VISGFFCLSQWTCTYDNFRPLHDF